MQKLIVASTNPLKINAGLEGFKLVFPNRKFSATGISVPSGISDQPMSDLETLQGAINRVENAIKLNVTADYYIGIEGGIDTIEGKMFGFAWVYIKNTKQAGMARTANFQIPPQIQKLVNQGMELGDADDLVFKRNNSKQTNGSVGLLTKDLITREILFVSAVELALIPFINPNLYY